MNKDEILEAFARNISFTVQVKHLYRERALAYVRDDAFEIAFSGFTPHDVLLAAENGLRQAGRTREADIIHEEAMEAWRHD